MGKREVVVVVVLIVLVIVLVVVALVVVVLVVVVLVVVVVVLVVVKSLSCQYQSVFLFFLLKRAYTVRLFHQRSRKKRHPASNLFSCWKITLSLECLSLPESLRYGTRHPFDACHRCSFYRQVRFQSSQSSQS